MKAGTPMSGALVGAQTCPTCPFVFDSSNQDGFWDFNPYNGEVDVRPTDGEESTHFVICDNAFLACSDVYHRPMFVNVAEPEEEPIFGSLAVSTFFPPPLTFNDADGDTLAGSVETSVYGTNPNVKDTDGDGIGDGAEVYGWNWVDYPSFGANPLHMDVFVEVDYVE
jgi:hypothetical protein